LRNGQNIVLVDEQFPSNYYTWERLCREKGGALKLIGPGPGDVGRGQRWGEAILNAINDQTAAVSMGHVHWADGTKFNLKAIGEKCRKYGAKLIVDGTQSVGALPFDINEIKPDALICAGYKWLMGPYSIAVGYFGPHFDGGVPIEENWINRKDSDQFEKLVKYQDEYRPLAWRYNMGECSNFIQVPMLTAAIDQLVKWTPAAIQDYCARLQAPFLSRLKELGCTVENDEFRSQHLFGIKLPENVDVIALKDELALRNVFVSIRGAYVRVAPHVYNEPAHFDMLVGAIQQALQVGAR
jgi:selenocysteine lyase/cysteine desulfurase